MIEYDDFMDEYLSVFEEFKNEQNKENGFSFKKILNITMLNNTPKNIAGSIIEQISDADNFNWRYV